MSEINESETKLNCRKCGNQCKKHESTNPSWYGSYENSLQVEVICIDCWNQGERWNKDK